MSIDLWHRATAAVRERYRASAPALYGAGLHIDRDDCGFGPIDLTVPAPRRGTSPDAPSRGPRTLTVPSR